jgi:hypothetical protein
MNTSIMTSATKCTHMQRSTAIDAPMYVFVKGLFTRTIESCRARIYVLHGATQLRLILSFGRTVSYEAFCNTGE